MALFGLFGGKGKVRQDFEISIGQKGAKKTAKDVKRVEGAFKDLSGSIKGLIAAYGSFRIVEDLVKAFAVQERAEKQLLVTTRRLGDTSGQFAKQLMAQASALQENSRFGDEQILVMQRLLLTMGAAPHKMEETMQAAADLAAEMGWGLEQATRQLGKTFGGLTGELGEQISQLKTLSREQLRAGKAVDILRKRYAGAAKGDARTLSGAIEQTTAVVGDLKETLGEGLGETMKAMLPTLREWVSLFQTWYKTVGAAKGDIGGAHALLAAAERIETLTMRYNVTLGTINKTFKDLGDGQTRLADAGGDISKITNEWLAQRNILGEAAENMLRLVARAKNLKTTIDGLRRTREGGGYQLVFGGAMISRDPGPKRTGFKMQIGRPDIERNKFEREREFAQYGGEEAFVNLATREGRELLAEQRKRPLEEHRARGADIDAMIADRQIELMQRTKDEEAMILDERAEKWKMWGSTVSDVTGMAIQGVTDMVASALSGAEVSGRAFLSSMLKNIGKYSVLKGTALLSEYIAELFATKGASATGIGPALAYIGFGSALMAGGMATAAKGKTGASTGGGMGYAPPGTFTGGSGGGGTIIINYQAGIVSDPARDGEIIIDRIAAAQREGRGTLEVGAA